MRTVTNEYYLILIVFIVAIAKFEFSGPVVEVVVVVDYDSALINKEEIKERLEKSDIR
jgi:hypothetical protein